jgi:isocitrate dehydrogenase
MYGLRVSQRLSTMHALRRALASSAKIVYTDTDEAPYLATYALLPIIQRFTKPAGINVEKSDISVAARIINQFNDRIKPEQRVPDNLGLLGELCAKPEANIIKLPNVSASIPQLEAAIKELQSQGYDVPNFPQEPKTDAEREIYARYSKVLGSAVNPVLREGNSDRRVAAPVKVYAQKNPHKLGKWSKDSPTHVAHMDGGDFFGSEKSYTAPAATSVKIELVSGGVTTVLKKETKLLAGEVIDAAVMDCAKLRAFYAREIADAKSKNILFSLHLKATMMKVSDPIMFGHCVQTYFKAAFDKHASTFASIGVNANNGLGDVYAKLNKLPEAKQAEVKADLEVRCMT